MAAPGATATPLRRQHNGRDKGKARSRRPVHPRVG
jgi:hypothetical protein